MPAGAHLRIVATSSAVNAAAIEAGQGAMEERGFTVSLAPHLFNRWQDDLQLAGEDRHRASDLMEALIDPAVDGIVMARGGYGAMRLLPYLDASVVQALTPKPVIGFSDVTAIHQFLFHCGWPSVHGPNAHSDWAGTAGDAAQALLFDEAERLTETPLEPLCGTLAQPLVAPWRGGNLAILASLVGLPWPCDWHGSILYLEEVHEKPYRIDRMLYQLYLSGILKGVRGIVFGEALFDTPGSQERAVKGILTQLAEKMEIPAWWGFPSGHSPNMTALPFGVPLSINSDGHVDWPREEGSSG